MRGPVPVRFVEQQQRRSRHQGASDREHLPFPAGELVPRAVAAPGERLEHLVHFRDGTLGVGAILSPQPPSLRFSSTVSSPITPRPSGTWATPWCTSFSVGTPRSEVPETLMVPWDRR